MDKQETRSQLLKRLIHYRLRIVVLLMIFTVAVGLSLGFILGHNSDNDFNPYFGGPLRKITPKMAREARDMWSRNKPQRFCVCFWNSSMKDSLPLESTPIAEILVGPEGIERFTIIGAPARVTEANETYSIGDMEPTALLDSIVQEVEDADGNGYWLGYFDPTYGFPRKLRYFSGAGRWPWSDHWVEYSFQVLSFTDLSAGER